MKTRGSLSVWSYSELLLASLLVSHSIPVSNPVLFVEFVTETLASGVPKIVKFFVFTGVLPSVVYKFRRESVKFVMFRRESASWKSSDAVSPVVFLPSAWRAVKSRLLSESPANRLPVVFGSCQL